MKHTILIILIISIFCFSGFASAQGIKEPAMPDWLDKIYQGIDQSKLVPLLTAALKEAIAKIESLEARVDALEV